MAQKFMTYEQQLNKLQADKGLTIPDADFARKNIGRNQLLFFDRRI